MESQAAFVLLAFLYLASPLATVQAVHYEGPATVNEGQHWTIKCTGHKRGEKFNWTRNGQPLEELSSGDLSVLTKLDQGTSEIIAEHATDLHEGNYRCTPGGNESFHLTVKSVTKYKVLTDDDVPMILECENRTTANQSIDWLKEGKSLRSAFENKEDIVKYISENGTIVILKDHESVYGNYSCNSTASGNTSTYYRIVRKPTAALVQSVSVTEGNTLHLVCGGRQTPGIKISWTFAGKNYNSSEGRVKLLRDEERGINRAVLNVENIEMEDRGNVSCRVSYDWSDAVDDHGDEAVTLLRVKDKLAALWPFLGICAEVLVLCAIILIYEKKRNKAELEESDTDQSPDTDHLFAKQDSEPSFVPLRGPLPPSDLPVHPPVTPPRPSSPVYKTVQFRSPSREPRRNSPLRSAPPSPSRDQHETT